MTLISMTPYENHQQSYFARTGLFLRDEQNHQEENVQLAWYFSWRPLIIDFLPWISTGMYIETFAFSDVFNDISKNLLFEWARYVCERNLDVFKVNRHGTWPLSKVRGKSKISV